MQSMKHPEWVKVCVCVCARAHTDGFNNAQLHTHADATCWLTVLTSQTLQEPTVKRSNDTELSGNEARVVTS